MSVIKKTISIAHIPAIIWGVPSSKVYLYIHGQGGDKEEAAVFAEIVCRYGFQILSIDLPEHGKRKDGKTAFAPWDVVPELKFVMDFAKKQWRYAAEHPIINWRVPTKILYGENDNMTDFDTIKQFVHKYHCDLTMMKDGGHWFHTEQELTVLRKWMLNKQIPFR